MLANGSRRAAEKIGKNALEISVQVKGLEAPAHDPRAYHGMGLAYAYANRGACHMQHNVMSIEQGMVTRTELGLQEDYEAQTSEGKAAMVEVLHALKAALDPQGILNPGALIPPRQA